MGRDARTHWPSRRRQCDARTLASLVTGFRDGRATRHFVSWGRGEEHRGGHRRRGAAAQPCFMIKLAHLANRIARVASGEKAKPEQIGQLGTKLNASKINWIMRRSS